jgi:hypothetical protein
VTTPTDDPATRLAQLADELEGTLADAASVERTETPVGPAVRIIPVRASALAVSWIWFGDEVTLETLGGPGGRWQLGSSQQDLDMFEAIVRSVVAGRVEEVRAAGRSRVKVTLADGTRLSETGYVAGPGCLPLPFWNRWGRRTCYTAYLP